MHDWMAPDGRARVEVAPKGNANDNEEMRRFARAVLAVEPNAVEGPISILDAGDTIVRAFVEAGLWAMLSIGILLWLVLRRIGDVLLTLIPLMTAGVVTLETLRPDRPAAQFRQYHRAAAAARRRRRLQDLLHHGVARGADESCCRPALLAPCFSAH